MILTFKTLKKCAVAATYLFLVSCSSDEAENSELENSISSNEFGLTSGGTCSSTVDFDNLVVETSWISEDKGDRDTFGACGVDGEAWMDHYSDGRFMLTCLAPDGHRTELKENTGQEANLTAYKKMVFTAQYSSIPSHGVTIAQIHNRNTNIKRPWLRLYLDADRTFKIKETETCMTCEDSADATYTTFDGMAYTQNTDVTITVWTGINGAESAKIRVDYNGQRFQQTLYPSSNWSSHSNHYYLKAGVYTEGEDKQPKVIYSAFDIQH